VSGFFVGGGQVVLSMMQGSIDTCGHDRGFLEEYFAARRENDKINECPAARLRSRLQFDNFHLC
jgi:hypothetical protein